jgi:sulfatase maturation enzyme AslB (radical SAM superfamily)
MTYQAAEIVHFFRNRDRMSVIPAQVDIDLTNICNQDCFYCNSAVHRANAPVQKKYVEYITLLDKLSTWRSHSPNSVGTLHTITFPGGGEPTVLNGYEKVLEHSIDLGFLTSMTTNGTKLHKLINSVHPDKLRKMAWVGIDIDAGDEETYETIRRSLTGTSPFKKVMENATELVKTGCIVDFKILLNQYNDNYESLEQVFLRCREVGVRLLYIRPAIVNGVAYPFEPQTIDNIESLKLKYHVAVKMNTSKTLERNYNRCHQMFQFPVMCADGHIYTCCDNKGNPNYSIGRWDQDDFRDIWLSPRHWDVYNRVNTKLCPPCRPNRNNIEIQKIMDNTELLEVLYT